MWISGTRSGRGCQLGWWPRQPDDDEGEKQIGNQSLLHKGHVNNYQDDGYIVVVDGMRCEIAYLCKFPGCVCVFDL
jgi:hypothetical protein